MYEAAGSERAGNNLKEQPGRKGDVEDPKKRVPRKSEESQECEVPWKHETKCSKKKKIVHSTECFQEVTLNNDCIVLTGHPGKRTCPGVNGDRNTLSVGRGVRRMGF